MINPLMITIKWVKIKVSNVFLVLMILAIVQAISEGIETIKI
jgi:hypothetical protein